MSNSPSIPEESSSEDDITKKDLAEPSVNPTPSTDNSPQTTEDPRQELSQFIINKIQNSNDPSEIEQLVNLWLRVSMNQEQVRENQFSRRMTVTFLVIGIFVGIASVVLEIPIVLGVAGILLGSSMFRIVSDYISKLIYQLNIPNVFPKITSSNLDNTLTIGDKDKNDDS